MTTKPFKVIIIGAGTGGLCLAHGLKKAGIAVKVYERDRTRAGGLQGYRVGISPDGNRALHECLSKELHDTFLATCARTPKYFNILTEHLSEVLCIDVDPAHADPMISEKSVSRMTLRQVLLTDLEDIVFFEKKYTHYEQHSDGKVTAFFEDGTSDTGDILVSAEGSNSRVRKQYLPHATLEDTGLISIGGKLAINDETKALLSLKMFNGISMVMAPKGYGTIIHAMEFKWDRNGVKHGIGDSDTELISRWPGLLYDNTRDYIMWGFWAARDKYPTDPLKLQGEDLKRIVLGMTKGWHSNLRKLISETDPTTLFTVNIRTSVPIDPWPTTNITLIGDAIHTMTPGRGVGANTALRDAALLCRNLTAAKNGEKTVIQAIHEYEAEMIKYGFEAVLASRKQMDGRDPIHKPVIGRIMLGFMRTSMRIVNAVPPLKKRMAEAQSKFRGANRKDDDM